MKKLVVLTSILALAACGGGSGGGHGGIIDNSPDVTVPDENKPGAIVTPMPPRESNKQITSIEFDNRTEIIDRAIKMGMEINSESPSESDKYTDEILNNALQFLKDHGFENIKYAQYKLDDIDFSFMEPDDQREVSVHMITDENGKIIAWEDADGDRFERDGETNYFNGKLGKIKLQTYGKDVGLHFSDFGSANPVDEKTSLTTDFAGTLPERYVDMDYRTDYLDTTMHFTGRAVGSVGYDGYDGTEENAYMPLDGKVDLVFGKGKESLIATFDNWYTIGIDTIYDSKTAKLTDGDKIKNDEYRFTNPDNNSLYSWAEYAGPDENTPTEVVGGIGIKDGNPGSHLNVSLSFGATVDK